MKVFISYSWKVQNWVIKLASELRKNGINIIVDFWDLEAGNDLNYFMEKNVTDADKVLIVCDESYSEKSNNRAGGVGTETLIISPDVYNNTKQTKFIPLLVNNVTPPVYLNGRLGIMFNELIEDQLTDKKIEEICKMLNDVKEVIKPPLGKNKFKGSSKFEQIKDSNDLNTLDGIWNEIFGSNPEDWKADKYQETFTYKKNLKLKIIENESAKRDFNEGWATNHPDSNAQFLEFDIIYDSNQIDTINMVLLDGGRAMLPLPQTGTNFIDENKFKFANIVYKNGANLEYIFRSKLEIK